MYAERAPSLPHTRLYLLHTCGGVTVPCELAPRVHRTRYPGCDTHAERFLGRKIARSRAHRRSLPRALPSLGSSLARSFAHSPRRVHVGGSNAHTPPAPRRRRLQSDRPGVPGRFFALKTSRLSRPGLVERGVTGCPFFSTIFPSLFSRYLRLSLPLATLYSQACLLTRAMIHALIPSPTLLIYTGVISTR